MSLESKLSALSSLRNKVLTIVGASAIAATVSTTNFAAENIDYKWVVGQNQLTEMVVQMLSLEPKKASDYFSDITSGKIAKDKNRTLNNLWEGDQVKFLFDNVPADKQRSVGALVREYDKNYGKEDDGLFAVKKEQYENAVRNMSHGHLNAEALSKGYRILTLYHVEKSFDGTVRRFVKGGEPKNDEIGSKEGEIYKAVRVEDVAASMKKLEGKYVFGLGKLFDNHPDVAKAFADYIRTAQVGLKNPLDEHYVISKEGRLHKLEDKTTWKYSKDPVLPKPGSPEREILGKVYDTLIWGPGFETPGTFEGQLGTPVYKTGK